MHKILAAITLLVIASTSWAAPAVQPSVAQPNVAQPNVTWNNQQPKQQRALDAFYRSVQHGQVNNNRLEQNNQRQIQVQQIRRMTPNQRQQQFLNYINQHQAR